MELARMEPAELKVQFDAFARTDSTRQQLVEKLISKLSDLETRLERTQSDLEDHNEQRAKWKERAMAAEDSMSRNQFVLVLVDGDGYVFQSKYLRNRESGGIAAAQQLTSDIKSYIKENHSDDLPNDCEVMVNVYANKRGLSKVLTDGGLLSNDAEFEAFVKKFNQGHPLCHFIDCGDGKESVDAKLRDTYRFFALNSHCRLIFLAVCHDNGYIVELQKYAHHPIYTPRTVLLQASQPARGFEALPFRMTCLDDVFEHKPVKPQPVIAIPTSQPYNAAASFNQVQVAVRSVQYSPSESVTATNGFKSSQYAPTPVHRTPSEKLTELDENIPPTPAIGKLPINRHGQRIDRPLRQPTQVELERFEVRVSYSKLCNEYHLRDNCHIQFCRYDHNPIDDEMRHTLRCTARKIPCNQGMGCRRGNCYLGHHCPWTNCSNKQCNFLKRGLHSVTDLQIAKFVPVEE